MSLQDSLFIEDAEEDVKEFLKNEARKRVLVFPPVNNYKRFLIHRLVQDDYGESLQTFSIGQGCERRLVVCYKSDFIRLPQVNGVTFQASEAVPQRASNTMGIESQCTPTTSPEHSAQKTRQVRSAPAVEIYRPPAARRARLEKSPAGPQPTEQATSNARASRQKRPDRAVYVPRQRRSVPVIESPQETQTKSQKDTPRIASRPPVDKVANHQPLPKEVPTLDADVTLAKMELQTTQNETSTEIESVPQVMEDQPIAREAPPVEETMDHQTIPSEMPTVTDSTVEKMNEETKSLDSPTTVASRDNLQDKKEESKPEESLVCLESDKRDRRKSIELDNGDSSSASIETDYPTEVSELCNSSVYNNKNTVQLDEKTTSSPQKLKDESCQKQDKKVIKQPLVSKVLVISTKENEKKKEKEKRKEREEEKEINSKPASPVISITSPEKKVKKVERPKSKPAPPPLPPTKINRDECDWDSLFDDNGDCLDPTLIEELSSAVGEVVIEKPKNSCKSFSKPIEASSDEFGHVLEIYNFPSDFKSSDLAAVFSSFKSGGFELKWVDDTHCLGVFSSPLVAAEVLASDHPFVKTRPLSEATALSKTKARRSSEYLQPYRNRPETCAALARRLVTKSLGVTLATARQEREQERKVLREAKEKKRLANKQREDVWEGIIAEKSTT